MQKRSILRKTFNFGAFTLLSRLLAFPRVFLQLKFLGTGALADAFIAAFKLPNFFRRIFAEGALSAAFIPSYVQLTKKKNHKTANGTMSLAFLFFEGIVLLLCVFVFFFPEIVLKLVTPGFSAKQISYAVPLLQILFPLLFFISSSALLSGALQAKDHFFAQSFGPVLHNIAYVGTLIFCLMYHQTPTILAVGILVGGSLVFILHVTLYLSYHFTFGTITQEARREFKNILKKFLPCLIGVGVVEINIYLDMVISSYLPEGSITLLYVGNRFMNLPLGIFAVAFSTILLPHFSRISTYAPKRLHFYLIETAKFITWMIVPTMLFLFFVAPTILTHFLSDKSRVQETVAILVCYSSGLVFYCFNKVLINMFYARHDTWYPTVASIIATAINLVFSIIGMHYYGAPGVAASTAISGAALTAICLFFLYKKHKFRIHAGNYLVFLGRYSVNLLIGIALFLGAHKLFCYLLSQTSWHSFFCIRWGYWIFTIPLFLFTMMVMFFIKDLCKLKLYFLKR
ncbi:murein biosynthesis integral membrane protein MurJ [Candidatus Dependentiae bacterium]|nr:murein biosynthesis integral membrane protein MurJ [Candidatus Dependentiae bacterium]